MINKLLQAMTYNSDRDFEYRVFNKKTFEFEKLEYVTEPGISTHLINAYEQDNTLVLDTVLAGNGNVMEMMGFDNINATGTDLQVSIVKFQICEIYFEWQLS